MLQVVLIVFLVLTACSAQKKGLEPFAECEMPPGFQVEERTTTQRPFFRGVDTSKGEEKVVTLSGTAAHLIQGQAFRQFYGRAHRHL